MKDKRKTKKQLIEELDLLRGKIDAVGQAREAFEAIRGSETVSRRLFEQVPDAIIIADQETGLIIDCNIAACDLLRKTRDRILGTHQKDIHPPELETHAREMFDEHVGAVGNVFKESRVIRSDGVQVPVEIVGRAISIGGKEVLQSVFRDITERKKTEKSLAESEERLRLMIQSTDDLIFMQDADGRYTYASGSRAYGITEKDMLGKTPHDFFDGQSADRIVDKVREVFATGRSISVENEMMLKGEALWFHDLLSPVRSGSGEVTAVTTISRNITIIKAAEIAVLESERRYRDLVEGTDDLITAVDSEGRLSFVNHVSKKVFGYLPRECLGDSAFDYVHPDDRARAQEWFKDCIDRKVLSSTIENRQVNKVTGDVLDFLWRCNFNWDEDGNILYTISIARDITEHKKLESQLMHTEKLESLGILVGGIAHDFNNLLMGIMGNIGLAQMKLPPESPVHKELERVESSARVAAELTNQMLAFSGKGSFDVRPLDISSLVSRMGQLLEMVVSKKVNVNCELAENLPAIEANVSQVQQVVMNLVTNASDAFAGAGGSIRLATGFADLSPGDIAGMYFQEGMKEGAYVFLEVVDAGRGMNADVRKRLFEPFFSTKSTGRGLGLASVLGIVKAHKGGLALSSEPGKGSTFRVFFPVSGKIAGKMVEEKVTGTGWRGSGTVLVVDDQETVLAVAREMLEQAGFTVITASDGKAGVETFDARREEIRLVVLDLTMPVMDGEEAFGKIRAIRGDVPIIVMSGYTEKGSVSELIAVQKTAFLQKPFMPEEFIGKVRGILGEEEQ